ncbi:hypothetical protein N0V86_009751 [Didymella sp. IMI 355093]|nr:hypothetical protein N0V86_009751 [Didymella sp. IMI 355093]
MTADNMNPDLACGRKYSIPPSEPAYLQRTSKKGTHTVEFMRFPAEIRNSVYNFVICNLPRTSMITVLPAIALISMSVHQEFMSEYVSRINYTIRSMPDIWYLGTLLDMHSQNSGLRQITSLTIANFTAIAHTPARANEVMDLLRQLKTLTTLSFDITLDDLHYGLQGRIKDMEYLVTEFELFHIMAFPKLAKLVVKVKQNGIQLTPETASLLTRLEGWLMKGIRGSVLFMYTE